MNLGGVGELGLIARLKPFLASGAGGDDAAVIADATGFVVVSTDMFIEGVHFDLSWMSPEDVGWRSLALALGDLAAKGADPAWALVSLALPRSWPVEQLDGLYRGMHELGAPFRLAIEGGDLSAIDGPAVISLTVAGRTREAPLARSAAEAGWSVAVTGPLGQAALALREKRPYRLVPRIEDALTSGEEAELVVVGPDETLKKAGLLAVGKLTADRVVKVIDARGADIRLRSSGYDHFA